MVRGAFRHALDSDTAFRDAWLQGMSREVRNLRAQCERLRMNSATERIIHYLETEGEAGHVPLRQSRKAWAAELGLSHEALYRSLKKLQEQGVLHIDGARLRLQDDTQG